VLGFPAKHALKLVLAGDEDGGIAGATRRKFPWNFAAGDAFGGVEHLEDGEAAAIADIESFAGNVFDGFESADVRIGNVEDVNVIADAGAIGRRVIGAEDFELGNDSQGGIENERDEMCFDAMGFATFGRGAGGVEIAEGGVVEAGVGAIVGEDFLEAEFGFAVGVDGIFRVIFGDGDGVGFAVGGGGGGEYEFFHPVARHRIKKIDAAGNIGSVERAGFANRFGDEGFAGEMHHRVDFLFGEDFFYLGADAEIDLAEKRGGRDGGAMAFLKVIQGDDVVAAGEKKLRADAADVARCSGDKNVQGSDLAFIRKKIGESRKHQS